ncbi:polyprenyl diphosphate synthase [Antribacter gilvus]|uniref:polyprenyl diphosphate synthase n=1 Tax=Antribacter gilvus TaxID=2304675 RepID=UPI000F78624F|nr:polyprenyl diphosphate synthase [Antribacter gilvus]
MALTPWLRVPIDRLLVARLRRELRGSPVPAHLGLIMDGNRRWARSVGVDDVRFGHRAGAEHLDRVLGWCASAGIGAVSVYVLSVDNITKRDDAQMAFLFHLLETVIPERVRRPGGAWELHIAGNLDLVPDATARALKKAVAATRGRPRRLTLAVGYDPYGDVADAVRQVLWEAHDRGDSLDDIVQTLEPEMVDARVAAPDDDIDLIIRTSGERRLSGFFPWRSVRSELIFCDIYWPGFRELDLLRALRTYARRRTGTLGR